MPWAGDVNDAILQNEGVSSVDGLVAKYRDLVWGIAYRLLRDRDDALDVTQDVLIRLHRNLARLAPDTRLAAWLTRVTTNAALNHARDEKTRRRRQQEAAAERPLSVVSENAVGLAGAIAAGIEQLPRQQRAVVALRLLEGRKFRDIAAVFEVSEGTVKVQFARAMRRLREQLADWR